MLRSARVFGHVSLATYFRILIPRILPADIDKVLFLDSDVIVRAPVAELYNQSIDGYTHAAVENPLCERKSTRRLWAFQTAHRTSTRGFCS